MPIRPWLIGMSALIIAAAPLRAQSGVSLWLGGGVPTKQGGDWPHSSFAYGAVQLGFPLIPVAVRGEAILGGWNLTSGSTSLLGSVVLPLKLPVVQPYAIAGFGRYGREELSKKSGVHVGAGVRAGLGRLGAFLELRYHQPIGKTLTTIGITL